MVLVAFATSYKNYDKPSLSRATLETQMRSVMCVPVIDPHSSQSFMAAASAFFYLGLRHGLDSMVTCSPSKPGQAESFSRPAPASTQLFLDE